MLPLPSWVLNNKQCCYSVILWGYNGIWWGTMGCNQQNDMDASDNGIYPKLLVSINVLIGKWQSPKGFWGPKIPRPYFKTNSNQQASLIDGFNKNVSDVMLIYQSNPIIDIRISRIFNVEMVSNDLMKQQQEKKVKQFEMVQYNVNFMVVEIIEQLKLDFHSLSCTSKFDVTSEILQTIPPKMLLESCIFDIYIYIQYVYETLAGPSCGGTCRSFCDQRDAMSLFSRKKPKFRHLGQETSWSWHGVGNHAAPKITGKYWDKWMLVHDQSYVCIHT